MQGSKDIPLNATGLAQAAEAAQRLKNLPITKIVASPQIRAWDTANIIAAVFNLAVHQEPDLRERHFGDYEGRAWAGLNRVPITDGNELHGPFDYPEGNTEPFKDLTDRSKGAIEKWMAAHPDEILLFVGHGGVFSAINHALKVVGHPTRVANAAPYEYSLNASGQWMCRPV